MSSAVATIPEDYVEIESYDPTCQHIIKHLVPKEFFKQAILKISPSLDSYVTDNRVKGDKDKFVLQIISSSNFIFPYLLYPDRKVCDMWYTKLTAIMVEVNDEDDDEEEQ